MFLPADQNLLSSTSPSTPSSTATITETRASPTSTSTTLSPSPPAHNPLPRSLNRRPTIDKLSSAATRFSSVPNPSKPSTTTADSPLVPRHKSPSSTDIANNIESGLAASQSALSTATTSSIDRELLSSATASALALALRTGTVGTEPFTSNRKVPASSSPSRTRDSKITSLVALTALPELKISRSNESVLTRKTSLRSGRLRQSSLSTIDLRQPHREPRRRPSQLKISTTPAQDTTQPSRANSLTTTSPPPPPPSSSLSSLRVDHNNPVSRHQEKRTIGTLSLQQQQQQQQQERRQQYQQHQQPQARQKRDLHQQQQQPPIKQRPDGAAVTAAGAAVRSARERSDWLGGKTNPPQHPTSSLAQQQQQQQSHHTTRDHRNSSNRRVSKPNLHDPSRPLAARTTRPTKSRSDLTIPQSHENGNLKGNTKRESSPRHHSSASSLSSLLTNRFEKSLRSIDKHRGDGRHSPPPSTDNSINNTTTSATPVSSPPKPRLQPSPPSQASDLPAQNRNMHQTSSRLLRMTEDERPFTRDFNDLFSTLMVSLPLTPHRVRFQKVEHTFTSEEAITNLGSLKFSQSNRMPDPKDQSRIVTTTTTTTFSMAKEMAKSVCQRFLEARFIESVDGASDFGKKSSVWQLTPKGMHILQSFCQRNGINQRHVYDLLESPRNTMHLVTLERDRNTDRLDDDAATMEVIFRRFAGQDKPNQKSSTSTSDSDSLHEYSSGLVGVKVAKERKVGDKVYYNTFTGKAAVDWLIDCSTVVDKRETYEIATLFIEHGLMASAEASSQSTRFQPTKAAVYYVTEKGQRVAGWIATPKSSSGHGVGGAVGSFGTAASNSGNNAANRMRDGSSRDSNANRMAVVCQDPALRLLFREFLKETHCEENLSFYLDVKDFLASYDTAKRSSSTPKLEVIRETLAAAYSLYNAFLAPGSPCELNIDHSLRTALAARMTRAVGDDDAMIKSLDEVARLFDQAQNSVFKLMASDSVPKFMRDPKYAVVLRERNFDSISANFTTSSNSNSGGVGRL